MKIDFTSLPLFVYGTLRSKQQYGNDLKNFNPISQEAFTFGKLFYVDFTDEKNKRCITVAKIGATWTPITEILGHLCQFYLDTKNGSHLDTFFATPINQFHLS